MRQFRLIIIYPAMNASFMRRIIAVAEAASTSIEFAPDFATFKLKYPDTRNATIVLSRDQCTEDMEAFRKERNIRMIAWDDKHSHGKHSYNADVCECIGDPFSLNNYQAAINLFSYEPSEREWIKYYKWGSLVKTLKLDTKNGPNEFKAFTDLLKLTNHPNVKYWQTLINALIMSAAPHHAPLLYLNCDGNKLKMHLTVGAISKKLLWSKISSAKKLYDSMIRFDVSHSELSICCEMSLSVTGTQIPAAILIVKANDPHAEAVAPSSLEDAG